MAAAVRIAPRGPFSLQAALDFASGWPPAAVEGEKRTLRLAFALDSFDGHAGVALREDGDGLRATVTGTGDVDRAVRQAERILGLDVDATAFPAVGERDPVVGELMRERPGLRPVCFHSPYEAAAWAVLSMRTHPTHARAIRTALAQEHGAVLDVAGLPMPAFPLPEALLAVEAVPGLTGEKVHRLHAVAEAALDGRLDPDALRAAEPEEARERLRSIRGIGPFYATLILIRGAATVDVLPGGEGPLDKAIAARYGPGVRLADVADAWRPFRTWVSVLLRAAGGDR